MKKILLLGLSGLLLACDKPPPTTETPIRPAMIIQLGGENDSLLSERFPGRVRAEKRAELSFNVPGFLDQFDLREGTRVKSGQEIARLDASVFAAKVNSAQAEFERAQKDLARYQRLWESEQAVARSEVDDRRSRLEVARTNLAAAQQELDNTIIRAPFDGVLVRRRVEAFSNVQGKQVIADLQDLRRLEVVIHVPERIFRSQRPRASAVAIFSGQEKQPVKLKLKSFASEADPQTQSYEVVLGIEQIPAGLSVLPGMSATVVPALLDSAEQKALWIPLTAIAGRGDEKAVWVVDAQGSVQQRPIQSAEIREGNIRVTAGLTAGEHIVAAGVSALRDGMKVRPLP